MKHLFLLALLILSGNSAAYNPLADIRTGIIGTHLIVSAGSSLSDEVVLVDYRERGRHRVELLFVLRTIPELEDKLKEQPATMTVMVNCTRQTYTTSTWLFDHQTNYDLKQYQAGDVSKWDDGMFNEKTFGNAFSDDPIKTRAYFQMICNSL